jgi:ribosomal protein L19
MRRFVFKGFIMERDGEGMHANFTLATVRTGAGIFSEHSGAKI